jgi:hypothetical protein
MSKLYPRLLETLITIGLIACAWFYAGHQAVSEYKQELAIEQAFANAEQQSKYDALAASYETLKTKRESDAKVIVQQVEKVIAGDVIYRNVCISDSGLQLANQALAGQGSASVDAKVPPADTP